MSQPSRQAVVYRVSYRRPNWKSGLWKYKLFNSPGAAEKYVDNLMTPPNEKTPEKYRDLQTPQAFISFGAVIWSPFEIVPVQQPVAVQEDLDPALLRAWRLYANEPTRYPTPAEWARWEELQ